MNENDKTEILEPVETPAENITEPSKDGRKCPKWLLPLVAAVCAVILVVAGIIGWNAYSGAKLAEAKEACATAADTVRNNANEYNALLNGDAALGVCLRGGILLCKLLFQFLHLLQLFHCHVVVHLF